MTTVAPPLPSGPGLYRIVLWLPQVERIAVGRLGSFALRPGRYVYVGSAKCGIHRRVHRHIRGAVRPRWHLDYLLAKAVVIEVQALLDKDASECWWATQTLAESGWPCPIPRFGASDCRCHAHLSYWADTPLPLPRAWTRHTVAT